MATVTHGPGLTNTVTALIDATKNRAPVVVFTGDTSYGDVDHSQYVDQYSIVSPTGAGFELARSNDTVQSDVYRATKRALNERRPIVLNIPINFQWQKVPDFRGLQVIEDERVDRTPIDEELDTALGAISSSKRPIVLAGLGASLAEREIEVFAETIDAPVATTLKAKGLFRDNSNNLGIFGTLSDDIALDYITRSDCVVVFGSSLNAKTTDKGSLFEDKRVIHVDVAPRAFTADYRVIKVLGDAASVASAMSNALHDAGLARTSGKTEEIGRSLGERGQPHSLNADISGINIIDALTSIDEAVPDERTLVIDTGRFATPAFQILKTRRPRDYVHTASFGSIGLSMGSAIGAQIGAPGQPALVVCGDGGLMNAGLNELSSAVRHQLDMIVVVINDRAYGAEYSQLKEEGLDTSLSEFDWPSIASVAQALGFESSQVDNHADLERVLQHVPVRTRPMLVELIVDPKSMPSLRR